MRTIVVLFTIVPVTHLVKVKVVPGGSHGYFFEVKVETVKLIGGR